MMRTGSLVLALGVLAMAWLGPLPDLARHSFAAHMTMHIAVVAVAAPLLALGIAAGSLDPVRRMPRAFAAIPASMIELVIVWAWHVPVMHESARHYPAAFVAEQASFTIAGVLLWIAVAGGDHETRRLRAGAGIAALLFTSMHMTLLGALFALANRPLFRHGSTMPEPILIADQQLGGVIMLLVGGAVYLLGGIWLTAIALRHGAPAPVGRQEPAG